MRKELQTRPSARHKMHRHGQWAETLACWWLRLKGWRILARRVRTPPGEIDIIARRGRVLAFVEVKLRQDVKAALAALHRRQQQRIVRAAHCWLGQHPQYADCDMRFDFIAIGRRGLPRHLADAFRPDEVLSESFHRW